MGFLDNLENTLKNLEKGEELVVDRKRQEADQTLARAAAPWAEQLKTSVWTKALLDHAVRAAHARRAKLYIAWIGTVLRLDLKEKRLELRPTPNGIVAAFVENGAETGKRPADLEGRPEALIDDWLS